LTSTAHGFLTRVARVCLLAALAAGSAACSSSSVGGDSSPTADLVSFDSTPLSTSEVISLLAGSTAEAETNVAWTGSALAAAWMSLTSQCQPRIGLAISRNDGATWTPPAIVPTPGGRRAEDPSVAIDSKGRVLVAWLGTAGGTDQHVFVAAAAPGT